MAFCLEFDELFHGSFDGAAEARFVPSEIRQGLTVVGQRRVCDGAARGFVGVIEVLFEGFASAIQFEIEGGGFERDDAIETPAAGGDVVHEIALSLRFRLPFFVVASDQCFVCGVVFAGEDDDACG